MMVSKKLAKLDCGFAGWSIYTEEMFLEYSVNDLLDAVGQEVNASVKQRFHHTDSRMRTIAKRLGETCKFNVHWKVHRSGMYPWDRDRLRKEIEYRCRQMRERMINKHG